MEVTFTCNRFSIRMSNAKLKRIAHEAGDLIRLTFGNDKKDSIQLDMLITNVNELKNRLNKRKDF